MQEYKVGQTYYFKDASDGELKPYIYRGGDPAKRESWMAHEEGSELAPAAPAVVPGSQPSPRWLGPLSDEADAASAGLMALLRGQPAGDVMREESAASKGRGAAQLAAHPVQQRALEAIPMLAAPGAAGAVTMAKGLGPLARLLAGAAVGGAEGAAYGMAEAEGTLTERLDAAKLPAAVGAVTGGAGATAVPGLNRLARPAAGRGARLGAALTKGAMTDLPQEATRVGGKAAEIAQRLGIEDVEVVEQIISNPESLRELFPDAMAFSRFKREVTAERSAAQTATAIRNWLPRLLKYGAAGAVGAGAAAGISKLLGGGQ